MQRPSGDMHIGAAIRAAREARKQPARHLAALLGYSPSLVSRWETGERAVPVLDLEKIEKEYDVEFVGIHRWGRSRHHMGEVCRVDLASHLKAQLRDTGKVVYQWP